MARYDNVTISERKNTPMSIWRDALNDSEHDLHQAAWLIFAKSVQTDTAITKLADQQDAVKTLLLEIIEDDYLFEADAPGDGSVPVDAMGFIEEWQITEALPTLLELLEVGDALPQIAESAKATIISFGADVLEDVLTWVGENDDLSLAVAELLPQLASENTEPAVAWLKQWIDTNDADVADYVDALIAIDAKSAEAYLGELSQNKDFEKDTQKLFRKKAKEAKKAAKQQLEQALEQEARAAQLANMQAEIEATEAEEEVDATIEEEPAEDDVVEEAVAEEVEE